MHYSPLQLALLSFMLRFPEERTLEEIESNVYRIAGRRRPLRSRQSTAALIRAVSHKISYYGAAIERISGLGRGVTASYKLIGEIGRVRVSVDEAIDINVKKADQ